MEAIEQMVRVNSRVKARRRWVGILALLVIVVGCGGSAASSSQAAPSGRLVPTSGSATPVLRDTTFREIGYVRHGPSCVFLSLVAE